ncbi:MAG: lipopolysaccharide biosynthesis protein [Solirubrobacteraceae bacterium]|nr:lipopolysaccharide biosynthesis protein [Solirubrobacteraceae bacterium]
MTESPDTQHLEAEHPVVARLSSSVSLGDGARKGAAWLGSSKLILQVAQFGFSIINARLLFPSEFGIAALALAIVAFGALFSNLGLAAAVVHAERATDELLNTVFWLNGGISWLLAVLIAVAAWPVSQLYGDDALVVLMLIAALNFLFTRAPVQTALLERTFNFRTLAIVETAATTTGLVVVPVAAVCGLGAPSLILGPLCETVILSVSLWLIVRWKPTGPPRRERVAALWAYSRGIFGFNVMTYWSRNLDTLALGGAVSNASLGHYNRAFNLMMVPVQQVSTVIGRVMFPSFARMRDDHARVGAAWIKGMEFASALAMPTTVVFATTAPALVAVLYGPRWAEMVPLLELLALSAVPQVISSSSGSVYRALGRTGLLFKLGCISTALSVVAIALGIRWGAVGVAAALLIKSWVAFPIGIVPLMRILGVSFRDFVPAVLRVVGPVTAMAAVQLAIRFSLPESMSPVVVLSAQLAAGGIVYLGGLAAVRSPAYLAGRDRFLSRRKSG